MDEEHDKSISLSELFPHREEVLDAMHCIFGRTPVLVKVRPTREEEKEARFMQLEGSAPYIGRNKNNCVYASTAERLPFRLWFPQYMAPWPYTKLANNPDHRNSMEQYASRFLEVCGAQGGKESMIDGDKYRQFMDFSGTSQFEALMRLWDGTEFQSLQGLKDMLRQDGLDTIVGDLFMIHPQFYRDGIACAAIFRVKAPTGFGIGDSFGFYELISPDESQPKLDLRTAETNLERAKKA